MNILCLDFRKEVAREQRSSMKFTSGPHVSFKNYVSETEEYISSLVNTLGSWYALNLLADVFVTKNWTWTLLLMLSLESVSVDLISNVIIWVIFFHFKYTLTIFLQT